MYKPRLTEQAHKLLSLAVNPGDSVIDATVGNGHDTCFLARLVGDKGIVFGFDIQDTALNNTRTLLLDQQINTNLHLFKLDHQLLDTVIPQNLKGEISAITFNLGYLPGSDKQITTKESSTLPAIQKSLLLLKPDGILSIMAYPGHRNGKPETESVLNWVCKLDINKYKVFVKHSERNNGPTLITVTKN